MNWIKGKPNNKFLTINCPIYTLRERNDVIWHSCEMGFGDLMYLDFDLEKNGGMNFTVIDPNV